MRTSFRIFLGLQIAGAVALALVLSFVLFIAVDGGQDGFYSKNVTGAMEPTLLIGDNITARSLPSRAPIKRNDLVVFQYPPDHSKQFVKRVAGLPGDTIAMRAGVLFVNNRPSTEAYAWHSDPILPPSKTTDDSSDVADFQWQRGFLVSSGGVAKSAYRPTRNDWGPLVIGPNKYFVLGDNRDNSLDSRYFGFVDRAELVATPRKVYFSKDTTGHIRWSRFGHSLR